MPTDHAIVTKDLTKKYEDLIAVDRLNISVEKGEIFGLLGPNGAGKTTVILMLLGLTEPTSGSSRVCGYDPVKEPLKVKRVSGYLAEMIGFYEDLTARQNLMYIAKLNSISKAEASERIDDALSLVGLKDKTDVAAGKMSRGMKQRLAIANVLLKKPSIAFLDEPTQGIDPKGVGEVLDMLTHLSREEGLTILLSSHLLGQVQKICDHVSIMAGGKIVAQGVVDNLLREVGEKWMIEVEARNIKKRLIAEISGIEGVKSVERVGNRMIVECGKDLRSEISEAVIKDKASLLELRVRETSLEDVYKRYLGA